MGCQRAIAKQVREGGGDYVLTLKRNQRELEREVRGYFETAREEGYEHPERDNEETADSGAIRSVNPAGSRSLLG